MMTIAVFIIGFACGCSATCLLLAWARYMGAELRREGFTIERED